MNYGEVLTKAWNIIWKHKVLWIFGILAGFSSSPSNSTSSYSANDGSGGSGSGPNIFGQEWERFFQNIQIPNWLVALLIILVIFLIILSIVLVTIGRAALIKGASLADGGAERLTFGHLFSSGMRYFWRVLLLNILVFLAVFFVVLIMAIPIILFFVGMAASIVGIICIVPLACALGILVWLFGVFVEQSIIALVTEDLGVMDALRRGWKVVTTYPGQYIVMAVILAIIGFVGGLIIGLPLFVLIIPPLVNLAVTGNQLGAGITVSVVLFFIYLPILLLLNGILSAYITSAWTVTFRRLTRQADSGAEVFAPPAPLAPSEPVV